MGLNQEAIAYYMKIYGYIDPQKTGQCSAQVVYNMFTKTGLPNNQLGQVLLILPYPPFPQLST